MSANAWQRRRAKSLIHHCFRDLILALCYAEGVKPKISRNDAELARRRRLATIARRKARRA